MVRIFTVYLVYLSLCFKVNWTRLGCDNHEQLSKCSVSGVLLTLWTDCEVILSSNEVYKIAASEFENDV